MRILQLEASGLPQAWITNEVAASHYASGNVRWTVGEPCVTMRGGTNARSGRQSTLDLHPIIATNGTSRLNLHESVPSLTNPKLWVRDRYTCAYCGSVHKHGVGLTREHIVPTAREGVNGWSNVLAACRACNGRKACRTPEEAGMKMLFMPYVPSRWEGFILSERNVRADVHEWLAAKVPKGSRIH